MQRRAREGVRLVFEDVGAGVPPLLFVHGWGCDHTFFAPQVAHFRHQHRCLAVDLRGFGASDKPQQEYTPTVFADDLAWLCAQLAVERPVAIAHSLGGMAALMLAMRHPDLAAAIVMLDMPTKLLSGPVPVDDPHTGILAALRGPDWQQAARHYAEGMFLPTDDPDRRETILAKMCAGPPHVLASALDHGWSCDLVSIAAACSLPALYIQAGLPRPELDRFLQICPQLMIGRTVGTGHFHQLEAPEQINAMLTRFLALLSATPRESAGAADRG
ncbi:MAG: alpha/beta hydrolase [Thermomicrobiales bacterium]